MAKKNKPGLFRRFLGFFGRKKRQTLDEKVKKRMPQSFQIEWTAAREKYKQLLLTKQVSQGMVVEKKGYKLHKTNDKLFRLDGESFSILIATGNTLYPGKDGKISGILHVDEGDLNLAIQSDFSKLENFLEKLNLPKADMDFQTDFDHQRNWRTILTWETFWKEQLLLQLSANTTALVLLTLGEDMKSFFESVATDRQKTLVRDEFFFLNHGKNSKANFPHGKNKNLFEFGKALTEFSEKINLVQSKREKNNEA